MNASLPPSSAASPDEAVPYQMPRPVSSSAPFASSRRYETPVVAAEIDGGYVIALPYGPSTDWLKNVLSAGRATLRLRGAVHHLRDPQIVGLDSVDDRFATKERRLHRRFGVRDAVVLRLADAGSTGTR